MHRRSRQVQKGEAASLILSTSRLFASLPRKVASTACLEISMSTQTKPSLSFLILISLVAALATVCPVLAQSHPSSPRPASPGRWRVKFSFAGEVEKNLIFDSKAGGVGSFQLLDTGPDDKPVPTPLPAVWSKLTNDRISISGDVELPLGTCCREIGTLIFKGKFNSSDSISGNLIFVTSVDEEENPYKYRSKVGSFIATRVAAGS
jgi:hypothetical protein